MNLISVLCCRLGNYAFPKPIKVVVSCRLGNRDFRKPITVVSFEELINELGQILFQFDDMEMNFSLLRPEALLAPSMLRVFRDIRFSQRASGARLR